MFRKIFAIAVFGALSASLCSAQYYSPVSTIIDSETWFTRNGTSTYGQATAQGPNDYQDLGTQTGSNTASSQFGYNDIAYVTGSSSSNAIVDPTGTVTGLPPHPPGGLIYVNLSATTDGGRPDYLRALATATTVFNVPANSSFYLTFDTTGHDQFAASWSLTGPNNTTYTSLNTFYNNVPPGQYTLTATAATEYLAGVGFGGSVEGDVVISPEPACGAIILALASCLGISRRHGCHK